MEPEKELQILIKETVFRTRGGVKNFLESSHSCELQIERVCSGTCCKHVLRAEKTECILSPSGSTDFAMVKASDVARSVLAGVTARMRQVSLQMNCMIMSLICCSMSTGWSPMAILVRPGRSIKVMFRTRGEG